MADEQPTTTAGTTAGTPVESADHPDGLNVKEAARQLGVHHQTIRGWIRRGQLPVTTFGPNGGIVRIHRADLQRLRQPPA